MLFIDAELFTVKKMRFNYDFNSFYNVYFNFNFACDRLERIPFLDIWNDGGIKSARKRFEWENVNINLKKNRVILILENKGEK